jgi:hypothetical protein
VEDHLDVRVDVVDRLARRFGLAPPDVLRAMDDLAVEVGLVDHVVVDQPDRADTRRGEIHRQRRAQPAGPDQQHLRGLQPALPLHAHARHDEMPRVPADLLVREGFGGGNKRFHRHF